MLFDYPHIEVLCGVSDMLLMLLLGWVKCVILIAFPLFIEVLQAYWSSWPFGSMFQSASIYVVIVHNLLFKGVCTKVNGLEQTREIKLPAHLSSWTLGLMLPSSMISRVDTGRPYVVECI